MTKQALDKLPEKVLNKIEFYRVQYTRETEEYSRRASIRERMGAYVSGLCDAGLITDCERRVLFGYMTL